MDYEKAILDEISKRDHAEETIEQMLDLIGVEYDWSSSFGFEEAVEAAREALNKMETACEREVAALREENARLREALEQLASPPLTSVSDESYSSYDEGFDDGLLWAKDKADAALASAHPAPAQEQGEEMRAMLERLVNAEAHYRTCHDHHGDSDIRTGMAWDSLRKRGDEARALLACKSAEELSPVIDATCRGCDWYDAYEGESCENPDRSCVRHSLFVARKPDMPPCEEDPDGQC